MTARHRPDPVVAHTAPMGLLPRRVDLAALHLGALEVWPPVVLAPMAGVTNAPFRTLCRRHGGGLYVSEMIGARGLVEGNDKSHAEGLVRTGRDAHGRSSSTRSSRTRPRPRPSCSSARAGRPPRPQLRLPVAQGHPSRRRRRTPVAYRPVRRDRGRGRWPPPVTSRSPSSCARASTPRHRTDVEAARIAADLGVAAVALHGRTAEERYGPPADWSAIARAGGGGGRTGARQRRHLGGGRRPDG
jgi:hypothetical protein